MPWKNGGGSTKELAIFPEGATIDRFIWRLSTATMTQSGPFSYFPQVDRTLALLSGQGLILKQESDSRIQEVVTLDVASQPYPFSGEAAIFAELVSSPDHQSSGVVDLNMMTQRDVCQHHMQRLSAGEHIIADNDAQQWLLYCAKGSATLNADLKMQTEDLILLEEEQERSGIQLHVQADDEAILFSIRIRFLNHTQITSKARSNSFGSRT